MRASRVVFIVLAFITALGSTQQTPVQASPGNPSSDCNGNGIPDSQDIATGASFDANNNGIPDECECDRLADGVDAFFSGRGTGMPVILVADDFIVPKGVHRVHAVTVQMYTTSFPPRASLELLEDDCGRPGKRKHEIPSAEYRPVLDPSTGHQVFFANLPLYEFLFLPDNLWLPEGRYWFSAVGIGDGSFQDQAAWATSGLGNTRGATAHIFGLFPYPDEWTPVEICLPTAGKTDMALCVMLDLHRVIWDNGPPTDLLPPKSLNLATTKHRQADDFLIPACREQQISYIEAWYVTNLNLIQFVVAEIYDDENCEPANLLHSFHASRTKFVSNTNVAGLRIERAEFCDLNISLPGGKRYWLVLRIHGGGAAGDRTGWLPSSRCDLAPCRVQLSHSLVQFNFQHWESIEHWTGYKTDLAFRIIGKHTPVTVPDHCSPRGADINGDGQVDILDWFAFISALISALSN